MLVTIQLVKNAAATSRQGKHAPPESTGLDALLAELGIELTPLHPGSTDESLSRYYVADLRDDPRGQHSLERLQQSPWVAAAYVKPQDALP
jgi:hypothetical protein